MPELCAYIRGYHLWFSQLPDERMHYLTKRQLEYRTKFILNKKAPGIYVNILSIPSMIIYFSWFVNIIENNYYIFKTKNSKQTYRN